MSGYGLDPADFTRRESEQTCFEEGELLESQPIAAPLIAGGVRCHGGFDADGRYVSPRAGKRGPAIAAWQRQHVRHFSAPVLEMPLEAWPPHYPNVAQSKFLLAEKVTRPMIGMLTRIGTVEGFGGNIGRLALRDLQSHFADDLAGTATAHLTKGLYEAHGRDEAGFQGEGGHRQMWFAARDIAFQKQVDRDALDLMVQRLDPQGYGGPAGANAPQQPPPGPRLLPDDIDVALEGQVVRMVRLLFIELAAYRSFAWAESVLSDPDLVAGDGEAARLVGYIRADERPHVEYLRTVLSEMRARTWLGQSGRRHAGAELIDRVWNRSLTQSLAMSRGESRNLQLRAIESELEKHPRGADLLEQFHGLGDIRPGADGAWLDRSAASADA